MGNNILAYYRKNIEKNQKIAFFSTLIIGIIAHFFKICNYLPNHDSLYNFYSSQNVIESGRWFLTVACGISSYFDLPWINGILSLIYVALTSVIIVKLFKITNCIPIILISGLLVTFPAVTETLFYGFTADGYMLAMLLSALAVYLVRINDYNKKNIIFSTILICITCGIYQAYLSFAMVLIMIYFIYDLVDNDKKIIEYKKWLLVRLSTVIIGVALYYILWKLLMRIQNTNTTDYQGINNLGLSFSSIFISIKNTIYDLINFLIEGNILKHGINLYGILNIVLIFSFILSLILALIKNKKNISKLKLCVISICCFALPFIICIWNFASTTVSYGPRMFQSIALIFIFSIIIFDKYAKPTFANGFAIIVALVIFNYSLLANSAYLYLNIEYNNSIAEASEMRSQISSAINEIGPDYELIIAGSRLSNVALDIDGEAGKIRVFANKIEKSLLFDKEHIVLFFNNNLHFNPNIASEDTITKISQSNTFLELDNWDNSHKVYIIDNKYIVLKL